ncbi:YceI family protein [Croceiramulus getboli]|nr:YceI family protein [Flavobacteriaceae bacterium YJPT1-3]
MKNRVLQFAAIAFISLGAVACKGDKKNEVEASEAEAAAATTEAATKFTVDPAASTINWVGSKVTGTHTGTVALESGVVNVNGDDLSGTFLIDMTSINVTDLEGDSKTSLENHLMGTVEGKKTDFFNVTEYPTAAFEITEVSQRDGQTFLKGNLTMVGEEKNIEFPATYSIDGDTMTLTSQPFTIDRTQWGIKYGSDSFFDNLGDKAISNDMQLEVKLVAKKA